MTSTQRWRQIGKVGTALAGAGICLSPLFAQTTATKATPKAAPPAQGKTTKPALDKVVSLTPDGSFRSVVLTRSGYLVPDARLTFTQHQTQSAQAIRAVTSTTGQTVVRGAKPGVYDVRIEAPEGTYQGTLRVVAAASQGSQATLVSLQMQVVAFTLTKETEELDDGALDADNECEVGCRRRLGLWALTGAGIASAIALPLALQEEHRAVGAAGGRASP